MPDAYLVSAARTPIGGFLGSLSTVPAPELGAAAIKAALERSGLSADQIDEVIMGNVLQGGVGQAPARQAALKAGLPSSISAVTVNKVCGSGLKAVMQASQAIRCGDAKAIIAGGMENMSKAPHYSFGLRGGVKLGDFQVKDGMVFDGLTCAFEGCHMGNHAEHIATAYDVSREDQDNFAAESQKRAAAALANGDFEQEITQVTVKSRRSETVVAVDEGPRPDTTAEKLAGLRTVFQKDGSVTAGNASTISDGAAAVVVTDEATAKKLAGSISHPNIIARIVASQTSGTDPKDLFIAPAFAIQTLLEKTGLTTSDIDLFEINEAFASQMLACCKKLELDPAKVNVLGGGISLGHPLGASGARVLVTLMHAMEKRDLKRGIASLCLGGGNAVAMLIERG